MRSRSFCVPPKTARRWHISDPATLGQRSSSPTATSWTSRIRRRHRSEGGLRGRIRVAEGGTSPLQKQGGWEGSSPLAGYRRLPVSYRPYNSPSTSTSAGSAAGTTAAEPALVDVE